ncbi:PEP-CTERM sorting domain-containing protein [Massilia sp. DWR3-1-1]|uniref:PEP-CTERM sorting domain-containing protein n=1 Tax=Massilia sp. DWR3-1-1 TaxID=2804559 RepID=UPI003CF33504
MNLFKVSMLAAVLAVSAALSGTASANVIGVKTIIIKQNAAAYSQPYLQVAEVIAVQAGTGLDVALASLGATAVGSSNHPNSSAASAIDGSISGVFPNIFHSAGGVNDMLTITFASSFDLSGLTIFGRSDCCSGRDIYDVRFYDATGGLLFTQLGASANNSAHAVAVNVPEPGSLALLAGGLLVLAGMGRRRG